MGERDVDKNNGAVERMTEAVRDSYEAAMESTVAAHKANARLARSFLESSVEMLEVQAEMKHRTLEGLAELAREQREAFQRLSLESLNAYDGFLGSLFSYYKEASKGLGERGG